MVVVADDHQPVAGVEFLLAPEDAAADLLVEVVGPFVGAGDDDDVLFAVAVVEVVEQLGEVVAGDDVEVWVGLGGELRERGFDIIGQVLGQGNVLAEGVGIGEDTAVKLLSHDVVEGALGEGEVEFAGEAFAVEGGGDGAADRGELGVVADEDDAAARGLEAELEEVGEEVAVAEAGPCGAGLAEAAVAPDHGGLVDDEDSTLSRVGGDGGGSAAVGCGFAEVDARVDGARLAAGVAAHDLSGSARRSEQFDRASEVFEDADEGGHGGRFARSGVASDDETAALLGAHEEAAQRVNQVLLTPGGRVGEARLEAVFYFVGGRGAGHGGVGVRRQVRAGHGQSTVLRGGRPAGIH